MNREQLRELIINRIENDDKLIGYFQATYMPSFWWSLLIGPLVMLGLRIYYVAVSNNGISFYKMSLLGKPDQCGFFRYNEITNIDIKKGLLQCPLEFTFQNGSALKLKGQLKGVEKIPKLTPELISHLKQYQQNENSSLELR